ncbi:Rab family GTPase [Flexithrix dorotheae]|uniref:Rab family GTPase n=1 Tax=Flexithrix dorotheae TaxID=70993 RepID=UPI0003796320|nr:Rab family GTPase [Flexithrix dorotheae]
MISKKVVLIGKYGVGKTSLIQQFVHQRFSEKYLTTIGVKIDKKTVNIDGTELNMLIWDIAGESTNTKIPKSYHLGAHGAIYVFDLTRPSTYENIVSELNNLKKLISNVPIQLVGNKSDLLDEKNIHQIINSLPLEISFLTSAKTGKNVESMFSALGKALLK